MEVSRFLPKKFSTRLIAMTLISGFIPVIIFGLVMEIFINRFPGEINRAIQQGQEEQWQRSGAVLRQMAEDFIRRKALDVALQLELYIQAHPEMTVKDLQNDEKFREIAVQPVGKTGYTAVQDSTTAINRLHENSVIENLDLHSLTDKLPEFWAIMEASLNGRYSHGYYQWQEPNGQIREKFMYIAPLGEKTADGVLFGVAATTYIDEFTRSIQAAQDVSHGTTRYLMSTVNRLIQSFRTMGFAFMGLGILVVLGLAYWMGIYFSRSINRLREATKEVNRGNLDVQIKPAMSGDVGELTEEFNRMVAQLATTTVKKIQLEESEEKYRAIFENVEEGIFETDISGNFTFVNDSQCKIFGYPRDELIGMKNRQYTDEENAKNIYQNFNEVYRTGKPAKGLTGEIIRKDGDRRLLEYSVSLLRDPEGHRIGFRGISRDVTEKRELEARLRQVAKMEAIGTLAGGIAHDFNNLLMGIQGRASLMLMDVDSSHPHLEHLKGIEDYVKSAADLTKQLLGFARGGKYEVKPTDINELIKKNSSMFGRTKKEIKIHRKYQKDLWTIEADKGQIDQVLMNLYVNAWQAMPGGGDLYLQTENVTLDEDYVKPFEIEPGKYVKISVTDTGAGMDEATQQRIFDPFFTTKEMGRGTGLGLASAYGIIKNHGGFINVYSEKNEGTTFNIYLLASESAVSGQKSEISEDVRHGDETVLLVDDEDMIIDVGVQLLENMGYTILIATNGKEAIEIYERNKDKIDLIILDMIMPDMSGGDTFDRLKEINQGIKVLLSSGYSINGQATEILERGCKGFLQKPFNMRQLSRKIREVLDK